MKKNTKKQLFEHQAIITGILVLVVVISTIGGSYAWFNSQMMNDEYNAFKEENFEISYVDNGNGYGDILSLVNQKPISDLDGNNLTPYRFSVTNLGDTEKKFSLKINLDQSIIEEDYCIKKLLSTYYIKYKIDNQEPQILGTLAEKDYEIYLSKETIMPGSSEIHELRIWIDENSPSFVEEKHFHAKVTVEEVTEKEYKSYQVGQAVTLLDGSKYHVLESSDSTMSKVKLISDYNITQSGLQDVACTITDFINAKIETVDQSLYCSTMNYNDAATILYGNFLTNLQRNLKDYETKIDNVEVKMPEIQELKKTIGITENQTLSKTSISDKSWLVNLNFWTMTNSDNDINYNWTLSSDKDQISLKQHESSSNYFGLRPVIIIDKENIK